MHPSEPPHGVLYDHQFTTAGCLILTVVLIAILTILLVSGSNDRDK